MSPSQNSRTPWRNALLVVGSVVVPLLALELALRPFVRFEPELAGVRKTTLFEADSELGWKLRPGANDVWGGIHVSVNAKGLRGPELDYRKPAGMKRILFLGDSVAFGYQVERHELTFPYQVQQILTRGREPAIQTINGGVGGYSPWQSSRFLAVEGIRYSPDLVVVSFVLNDVTEKFDLARFGGSSEGFQLARSVRSRTSRWLSKTAIGVAGRRVVARLRFGSDATAGARDLSELRANQLALEPESDAVESAWKLTLPHLAEIFDFCRAREIPALLVAFPYTFQLANPALDAPQRRLENWAVQHEVEFIDLLPVFVSALTSSQQPPKHFFLDQDHPNPRGHAVAAAAIADGIRRMDGL